jgi:hypothetical protein
VQNSRKRFSGRSSAQIITADKLREEMDEKATAAPRDRDAAVGISDHMWIRAWVEAQVELVPLE